MYAKGLAQGLAHKDSISSRDNYHHLFTQQTFMKRLLYAKGTGSLGSAPVLMELTVHGGERGVQRNCHTSRQRCLGQRTEALLCPSAT